MATKPGWMIIYPDGLLQIKSHKSLITWSCKIMWQTKTITPPIPQCLCLPKLVGCWLPLSGSHPISYSTLWWHSFARSHDKLNPLYLHNYSTCYHQSWQDGDLSWGDSIVLVTWSFNHVALLYHLQTKNMSLLLQYLWPANLTRWWWHTLKSSNS